VHRDLKPGNIMVTAEGSPEQVLGATISTATDIYSLGAVLYYLLTGRSAHRFTERTPEAIAQEITAGEITRPSQWESELKGDLESILLKALRKDPLERYQTMEQFAEDLEAFLASRPVKARSGNAWYHGRKFVRRYWIPVTAAALVMASLSVGLYIANRERAIAERRFGEVRRLANKVLGLDELIRVLPGSTKARNEIVAMSQEYLEGLRAEARTDQTLAFEIANAYYALARTQGSLTTGSLGQAAQAEASLAKAAALLDGILKDSPHNRNALLLSAEVAHNRMILASSYHRSRESLTQVRIAAMRLDALSALGPPSPAELSAARRQFSNIALALKNEHLYADAIRYGRRAVEIARLLPGSQQNVSNALSVIADSQRLSGDLEGALETIRASQSALDRSSDSGNFGTRMNLHGVLTREGVILGQDGNVNLERPSEAIVVLAEAVGIAEELARTDPHDASSRIRLADSSLELARILAHTDPQRALAVYEKALSRIGEVQNNTLTRRQEATLRAGAAYPLRQLHRIAEAQQSIEIAFRLLQQTKDYPADRIAPGSEADAVLRAWGAQLADMGVPGAGRGGLPGTAG
jgi:serine/threonine-protein kinase